MGITSSRPPRDATLLAELAAPLSPARLPFYARSPDGGPAGWYWNRSEDQLEYLGRNVFWAERKLIELRTAVR
jgi:hypothetical protein